MRASWAATLAWLGCSACFVSPDALEARQLEYDQDGDGSYAYGTGPFDCDDQDGDANLQATEICDGKDNDCDGAIDEGLLSTRYPDEDGDGYGDGSRPVEACPDQTDLVEDASDCNDKDPNAWQVQTFFADNDQDGFGSTGSGNIDSCGLPEGNWSETDDDCNDDNDSIHPSAAEICDSFDSDCDGSLGTDEVDGDNDSVLLCDGDCDDDDNERSPQLEEWCDGKDNDCDGTTDVLPAGLSFDLIDDYPGALGFTADEDGDGVPVYDEDPIVACTAPLGMAAIPTDPEGYDCDDERDWVYPGAPVQCDGLDTDCDDDAVQEEFVVQQDDSQGLLDAIAAAEPWICVEPGTYDGPLDFDGADVIVESMDGPESTTIAVSGGTAVRFVSGESPAARLEGFTITGGDADVGAGALLDQSSPTLVDLVFTANGAASGSGDCQGGVISLQRSSAKLQNVDVIGNLVDCRSVEGGMIYIVDEGPELRNVRLLANDVTARGGAGCSGSTCAVLRGGAIGLDGDSDTRLENVLIAGNDFAVVGANAAVLGPVFGIWDAAQTEISNTTISLNHADFADDGVVFGAFEHHGSRAIVITNSDISSNSATGGSGLFGMGLGLPSGATVEAYFLNTFGNTNADWYHEEGDAPPAGTLFEDPLYVDVSGADPTTWDLRLDSGSPLIDAGDDGITDPDGSTSDIGAYGGVGASNW